MSHLKLHLILLPLLATHIAALEIRTINQTSNRLVLEIRIPPPRPHFLQLAGRNRLVAWWDSSQWAVVAGKVEAVLQVPLLYPPGAEVTVNVLQQRTAPLPEILTTAPEADEEALRLLPSYPDQGSLRILFQRKGILRGFGVGQLWLPLHQPAHRYLTYVKLEILFSPEAGGKLTRGEPPLGFINRAQAHNWRLARTTPLGRAVNLPAGTWFRIPITANGIYSLSAENFPPDVQVPDPAYWRLYSPYWNGYPLKEKLPEGEVPPPNLQTLAYQIERTTGSSSRILFYARGPQGDYNDDFQVHPFADTLSYWLVIPDQISINPDTITTLASTTGTAVDTIRSYRAVFYHELDQVNILHSGQVWVGEQFNGISDFRSFNFQILGLDTHQPVTFSAHFLGTLNYEDRVQHYYSIFLNEIEMAVGQDFYDNNHDIHVHGTANGNILREGSNLLLIQYSGSSQNATSYLDSFRLDYYRYFVPQGEIIQAPIQLGSGLTRVQISAELRTWDVTDFNHPTAWQVESDGFQLVSPGRHFLVAFTEDQIRNAQLQPAPPLDQPVLRTTQIQADYIVITPRVFGEQARRFQTIRENLVPIGERMAVVIAYLDDIYLEFSGGVPDPMALKYFLAYAYHNWQAPRPQYVLLLGDGDFDYRNLTGLSANRVPTWQINGLSDISSYATDDRYVYVDGQDVVPDLAIGRIPAQDVAELEAWLDKLEAYLLEPPPGLWRNTLTLVGDDPLRPNNNEPEHIYQSENIAGRLPRSMLVKKIYLTEYPEVQDPNSPYVRKPAAKEDLLQKLYDGTVLVNYMGHGSPYVWAQEQVFVQADLSRVQTGDKLPFWTAGTCDWGKFDDLSTDAVSEDLLLMEHNGAIGALAATRKSFSTTNANLFYKFFDNLFPNLNSSRSLELGIAVMLAKAATGNQSNNEKYILFCDPALKLATPVDQGRVLSIDPAVPLAMGPLEYTGDVGSDGLPAFGTASITAYDSPRRVTRTYSWYYHGTEYTGSLSYNLPGKRIFRGLARVEQGQYQGRFIVPKDIRYQGRQGILNVLYWNDTLSGVAFVDTLSFQGSDTTQQNQEGPRIRFLLNHSPLMDGDRLSANEPLEIELRDPQGINLTGSSGHSILLVIDDDQENALELTDLFSYDLDSTTVGRLSYTLSQISPGEHTLWVQAWDNLNNPGTAEITLDFFSAEEFRVYEALNFPNPMTSDTHFTFRVSHPAQVVIRIFTLSGRKIRELQAGVLEPGFNQIYWDGLDRYGKELPNGVYLYTISAKQSAGKASYSLVEKLVIAR